MWCFLCEAWSADFLYKTELCKVSLCLFPDFGVFSKEETRRCKQLTFPQNPRVFWPLLFFFSWYWGLQWYIFRTSGCWIANPRSWCDTYFSTISGIFCVATLVTMAENKFLIPEPAALLDGLSNGKFPIYYCFKARIWLNIIIKTTKIASFHMFCKISRL